MQSEREDIILQHKLRKEILQSVKNFQNKIKINSSVPIEKQLQSFSLIRDVSAIDGIQFNIAVKQSR